MKPPRKTEPAPTPPPLQTSATEELVPFAMYEQAANRAKSLEQALNQARESNERLQQEVTEAQAAFGKVKAELQSYLQPIHWQAASIENSRPKAVKLASGMRILLDRIDSYHVAPRSPGQEIIFYHTGQEIARMHVSAQAAELVDGLFDIVAL